jgi:hypothetical protein
MGLGHRGGQQRRMVPRALEIRLLAARSGVVKGEREVRGGVARGDRGEEFLLPLRPFGLRELGVRAPEWIASEIAVAEAVLRARWAAAWQGK